MKRINDVRILHHISSFDILKSNLYFSELISISEQLQDGNTKALVQLVQHGLLQWMEIIGQKFKADEIFVPEVLVCSIALNKGTADNNHG